ncbi:MAG TPA: GNAT family N-acetyltransferase [Pelobium sp.]|nr:GNAT family N-acetyltransferase [Pelobium sp.]
MIQTITIQQKQEWNDTVQQSFEYDFYHTWYYHNISRDGEPVLFKFTEGEDFIAIPLLRREIVGSHLADLTCVYGYTGPLSNKPFASLKKSTVQNFKTTFLDFLKKNRYITVFSRLNPFFNQLALLKEFGGVYDNGKVVYIDLRQSIEAQRSQYKFRLTNKIESLRKKGFYVKEATTREDVKAFTAIYQENMRCVHANEYYMFSEDYFIDMMRSKEFICKLLLVYCSGKAVCGATVVCTNKIIQSHLLGTLNEYRKYAPAKLLTEEISLIGRRLGMHYFNLGGGYGFKEDSLFLFKSSFSDLTLEYKSWRFVADKDAYQKMLCENNIDPETDVDFFPLYRYINPGSKKGEEEQKQKEEELVV